MKVKIGKVVIPNATVKRFIDLQSGLPRSMIRVTYLPGVVDDGELVEAFKNGSVLPFECEILKTRVVVSGFGSKITERYFTLREDATTVSCDYRKISYEPRIGKEKALVIPKNVRGEFDIKPEELRLLPYIRLILKDDVPETCLERFP